MNDFVKFLEENGWTQAQMDRAAETMPDPLPRQIGEPYCLGISPIHGIGCFATRNIDGLVGKLRKHTEWYEAGRYVNHAEYPNAKAAILDNILFAYGKIKDGEEITLDYRQVKNALEGHANV